jgi:phage-related protein (TIGR01555 family)
MGYQWTGRVFDTLSNVLASIGVINRDKSTATRWTFNPLTVEQIEFAYRGDWVTRKIIDIPAMDSTRAWRDWQAEDKDITRLEELERNFDLQNKVYEALRLARLYGGSVLIFGGGDNAADDMTKPLNLNKVGRDWLRYIHVFGRWNVGAGPLIRDILDPWFGEPMYYSPTALVGETLPLLQIHPSWVVRFWGAPYSDPLRAFDPWADSVLQAVNEAVQNAAVVGNSIASMIYEGKFDVIKIPRLTELANTDAGQAKLQSRFATVNTAKSYVNSIVMDAEEEWQRVTTQFSGMEKVLQVYLMIASGAADIPATRMLGQSPVGMNATGDSDVRNYYDRLSSDQVTKIQPRMSRLDEVVIRSALGHRDPELHYKWNPLWQLDAKDKALIDYQKAQAAQIEATIALVPAQALAIGRQNQLVEDGVYPGLEQAIEDAKVAGDYGSGEVLTLEGKRLALPKPDGSTPNGHEPAETPQQEQALTGGERTVAKGRPQSEPKLGPDVSMSLNIKGQPVKTSTTTKKRKTDADALDYNEEHDPQTGQFTGPGAGGGGYVPPHASHPGQGYTPGAYMRSGRIYTDDVDDAVLALSQGRKVELNQPKQISTLIDKLGRRAAVAIELGHKAPKFNLCDVSVKGTNLFCADTKGIPRIEMPQLPKEGPLGPKAFRKFLQAHGYDVVKDEELASHLRATQDELEGAKAAKIARKIDAKGEAKAMRRLFISKDDYILDGHHHWAAKLGVDSRDGKLDKHLKMKVARVNVGITKLLELAREFTGGKGAKGFGSDAETRVDPDLFDEITDTGWEGLFIDPDEDPKDEDDSELCDG